MLVRWLLSRPDDLAPGHAPVTGYLTLRPTRPRVIVGDPDNEVLPLPFTVALDATGRADVELAETGVSWAWQVEERVGTWVRRSTVAVPAGAGPIDHTDLVHVDPATLAPTAEPEAAWWVALNDTNATIGQTVEDYLVANPPAAAPDATTTIKGLVQLAGDLAGTAAAPTVPGLATKADAAHTHVLADVTDYVAPDLSGYATTTALTAGLAGKAASSHTHTASQISDSTTVGRSVVTAANAAAARTAIGAGTSSLTLGTTGSTAAAGNDSRLSDARTPLAHTHGVADLTATGTADATTFLRGDNSWAVPAGGGGGGGFPVQRMTLSSSTSPNTSTWPTDQAVTLVVTQNATGGHTLTGVAVDTDPNAVTVTAWVWSGSAWLGFSSVGSTPLPPGETAPAWASGTTATTGDPGATSVVVTFSQAIPTGQLQVRYGSGDVWRDVTADDATTVTLSGLTASTVYVAPEFRVINSAGASTTVTAQGFTTDATPPGWVRGAYDTFTDTDGTTLSAHTPEMGTWTGGGTATIYDNMLRRDTNGTGGAWELKIATSAARPKARISADWGNSLNAAEAPTTRLGFTGNYSGGDAWVFISPNQNPYCGSWLGNTYTETSGITTLMPVSAHLAVVYDITAATIQLYVNDALFRSWNIGWGGTAPTHITGGYLLVDALPHLTQVVTVDNLEVEEWR